MPSNDGITVYLTTPDKRKVDEVRGKLSRTEWVRRTVAEAIGKRRRLALEEEPWPMLPEPAPPPPGTDLRSARRGKFHPSSRFDLDAALRAVSILRLRSEGKSFQEIAKLLGYNSVDACRVAYKTACDRYVSYHAAEYAKVILAEHVADIAKIDEVISNPGYKTDVKGALVVGPDGEWLEDENIRVQALTERRKTLESVRRMTGVDAPKRTELAVQIDQELNEKIRLTLKRVEELTARPAIAPAELPDDDIVEAEEVTEGEADVD